RKKVSDAAVSGASSSRPAVRYFKDWAFGMDLVCV
ncbi:hypothetical protein EVA_21831, partial [gut metagenome]